MSLVTSLTTDLPNGLLNTASPKLGIIGHVSRDSLYHMQCTNSYALTLKLPLPNTCSEQAKVILSFEEPPYVCKVNDRPLRISHSHEQALVVSILRLSRIFTLLDLSHHGLESFGYVLVVSCTGLDKCASKLFSQFLAVCK